jgi:hypothetical protein
VYFKHYSTICKELLVSNQTGENWIHNDSFHAMYLLPFKLPSLHFYILTPFSWISQMLTNMYLILYYSTGIQNNDLWILTLTAKCKQFKSTLYLVMKNESKYSIQPFLECLITIQNLLAGSCGQYHNPQISKHISQFETKYLLLICLTKTPCRQGYILHLSTRGQCIPQFDSDQHEKSYQQSASETMLFYVRFEVSTALMLRSHMKHYIVSWVNEYILTSFETFSNAFSNFWQGY